MILRHLIKYFSKYTFILFVICSFVLRLEYNKTGLEVYYIIATLIFISGFTKYSLIKDLGLSFDLLKNKTFYFYQIPVVILSNIFVSLFMKNNIVSETQNSISGHLFLLILGFFFFTSIRTFGEEFIFRAILLIKDISCNNTIFWILNSVQAFLFGIIHYYIADDLASPTVFGIYVFVLSIYFGWINRKFNSLLPSWTIHWFNGILTLIIAVNY